MIVVFSVCLAFGISLINLILVFLSEHATWVFAKIVSFICIQFLENKYKEKLVILQAIGII